MNDTRKRGVICLDASPPPIQSGCACRGNNGLAIDCRVQAAVSQLAQQRFSRWWQCQTCKQHSTGAMQLGLARAWQSRVSAEAQDSEERLAADGNLAKWMLFDGNYAEAASAHAARAAQA